MSIQQSVFWQDMLKIRRKHVSTMNMVNIIGPPPGWETKTHNRYISKDRELLKVLERESRKGPSMGMSWALSFIHLSFINGA